jgi:AcrR family transcriptional regulator
MPHPTRPTRARLVDAAAELLRRQGLPGTGVKQILSAAEAPFSSLYHHFPGGKEELAAEAIRTAGDWYQEHVQDAWDAAPDLPGSITAIFDGAAQELIASDYADACPIATVALEVASTSEPLRLATAGVFDAWIAGASARLTAAGIDEDRAVDLARTIIALLEGAFILARASKTTDPMHAARQAALILVNHNSDT